MIPATPCGYGSENEGPCGLPKTGLFARREAPVTPTASIALRRIADTKAMPPCFELFKTGNRCR